VQWSRVAWLHVQGGLDAGRGTNSTQTPPAFSGVANHALIWGTLPWSSSLYVDLTLDARRKRKLPVYRGLALYLVEDNVADVSDDSSVHKRLLGLRKATYHLLKARCHLSRGKTGSWPTAPIRRCGAQRALLLDASQK